MDRESTIQEAIEALKRGEYPSERAAARAYKLPQTLLTRRNKGKPSRRQARSKQQNLSDEQEKLLVRWIQDLEATANAPTHAQLKEMATLVSSISGGPLKLREKWVRRFIKRNPGIRTKRGVPLASARAVYTTNKCISSWFSTLAIILSQFEIKTANIWNMDETGNALGIYSNQTVIGAEGTNRIYVQRPQNREWASVIECISPKGRSTTPLVIFKSQHVQQQWFIPERTSDWYYTCSDNAYTSDDIGLKWLQEIYLPQTAVQDEYRLLLIDGHGSHTTIKFMWHCYINKVYVYYLPPHTSHLLQPLDLSIFSSLKRTYRAAIALYSYLDDNAPIKKQRFLEYYERARTSALTNSNCASGFTTAGIVPWHPQRVLRSQFIIQEKAHLQPDVTRQTDYEKNTLITTPHNRRHLLEITSRVLDDSESSRTVRRLLFKTGKAFDTLHFDIAVATTQIKAYEQQLENTVQKNKKKAQVIQMHNLLRLQLSWTPEIE